MAPSHLRTSVRRSVTKWRLVFFHRLFHSFELMQFQMKRQESLKTDGAIVTHVTRVDAPTTATATNNAASPAKRPRPSKARNGNKNNKQAQQASQQAQQHMRPTPSELLLKSYTSDYQQMLQVRVCLHIGETFTHLIGLQSNLCAQGRHAGDGSHVECTRISACDQHQ